MPLKTWKKLSESIVFRDLNYIGGTPDETEEFEIVRATPAEIEANIRTGVIWDGMTIAAWSIANSVKE